MNKQKARDVCDKFWEEKLKGREFRHANVDAFDFLDWLYRKGYKIVYSPTWDSKVAEKSASKLNLTR